MTTYFILKFLRLIGAVVLIGTGAGIAFFMGMAHATGNPTTIAGVADRGDGRFPIHRHSGGDPAGRARPGSRRVQREVMES